MDVTGSAELRRRLRDRIDAWRIVVEHVLETDGSILASGLRENQSVVLKVVRHPGEEWSSGAVLDAFGGNGVVRAVDHTDGAVLLERLRPGTRLVSISVNGEDDRATAILADVMGQGYATEGLRAMVDVARLTGVARLYALCHTDHRASWHVLEKCGFTRDGSWSGSADFPNLSRGAARGVVCYAVTLGRA